MDEYLNEKEQWERVLAWLREQGPWMLAGVAVVAARCSAAGATGRPHAEQRDARGRSTL